MLEGEVIHVSNSHKYTQVNIEWMAHTCNFNVEKHWLDNSGKYSFNLFIAKTEKMRVQLNVMENMMKEGWKLSDLIFSRILHQDSYMKRPIQLRHPIIFYLGHLTAFNNNQIFKYLLKIPSTNEVIYYN